MQFLTRSLWAAHLLLKDRLVAFIRQRSFQARINRGDSTDSVESARNMFERDALTIGFARTRGGYKRWNLLLRDPERLLKIINSSTRPVQFVFAGKAHPQDQEAKVILQQVAQWEVSAGVGQKSVFLQNYDHEIARQLVQSVDVWLNVPRRPLEASGTSGEKVAMNGGLNLSCSMVGGWKVTTERTALQSATKSERQTRRTSTRPTRNHCIGPSNSGSSAVLRS
jgi:starch phosphorylase